MSANNDSSTTEKNLGNPLPSHFQDLHLLPLSRTELRLTHFLCLPKIASTVKRGKENEDQMPTFASSHILLGLGGRVICTGTHVG